MSNEQVDLKRYDAWLNEESDVAALVMRQYLESVEGKDGVIFPPTYAKPESMRDGDWTGYNLDRFENGLSVCQIDSVGAQANRIEPVFKRKAYAELVPQIEIKVGEKRVDLLDASHRAADAIVRFSDLAAELDQAFHAARDGDARKLASIAPTSLVFGAWDSRGTQVKLPRIVRSVIRAFNVRPLHRSAQYIPTIDYVDAGLLDAPQGKERQDAMSQLGLSHAPAPWTHGGVLIEGEIRRDASLNLVALRALGAGPQDDAIVLRRYILGLSLVALTAPQESFLREGCQVVPDRTKPAAWTLVRHDGSRDGNVPVSDTESLEYAKATATAFGVGKSRKPTFSAESAREALVQSKEERKKASRSKSRQAEVDSKE